MTNTHPFSLIKGDTQRLVWLFWEVRWTHGTLVTWVLHILLSEIQFNILLFKKKQKCLSSTGNTSFIWSFNKLNPLVSFFPLASYFVYLKVNLDAVTREETRQNVSNACPSCFDEAQKIIYTLMEKDSYRRFLNSKLIQDLCQRLPKEKTEKKNCDWSENSQLLTGGA